MGGFLTWCALALSVMSEYPKPVKMSADRLAAVVDNQVLGDSVDPAHKSALAHATAEALIYREAPSDPAIVERLVVFADEHGLDVLASLWSEAHPTSLPGALWRLYLVRAALRHTIENSRVLFQEGVDQLNTIDQVVAGAPDPLDTKGLEKVLDDVLRGAFSGDLAQALERAAAIARAISAGSLHYSWINEPDAHDLATRSLNWSIIARELSTSATTAREGKLS